MKREKALSMDEAKKKLADLENHMPGNQRIIYEFGRMLSKRLGDELVPVGFVLACKLFIFDLHEGVDGFSGEPINSNLVGLPPIIYTLLSAEIPHIADAIFPADFAAAVKSCIEELSREDADK